MNKVFVTKSFEETQKLGEEFVSRSEILLRRTKGSIIIALYGDLGSGKTTFVQGMAKGLGIKKRIISPTFIIVRSYKTRITNKELGIMNFYHIDLYRVQTRNDLEGLGLDEIIRNPENIVAIEWAEKMKELLPKKRIDVKFEYLNNNRRKITIENPKFKITSFK